MTKKITIKKIIDNKIISHRPDFNITWYEEIYYWFWRRWDWIRMLPREIKWFIQRGRRGFADCDVWNLGYYVASWMPEAIKQLRKNVSGCPGNVFDKTKKHNQCWRWKVILKKIEDGFEAFNKLEDCKYGSKRYKQREKKFNEGIKLFVKYF